MTASATARLIRLAAALRAGMRPHPEDAAWAAQRLDAIAAGADPVRALDLGAADTSGRRKALQHRDNLIRGAAAIHLADMSRRAQAITLQHKLARYAASGWRWEASGDAPPQHRAGKLEGLLWAILKTGAPVPTSARQFQNILSRRKCETHCVRNFTRGSPASAA
ncbi:hypothetical protein [Nitrospirillum viridazoti]|uniref:Uncharacterized protein n=1 Tax=Nitrospirillum amazonense TaxID=28077 RepID=A0A560IT37_9PROT|nr:hypothetical protein [Nitrospirillum amazonense]TWB62238.1 hypothetical protein FBZ92_105173 [Nitrospirillum amazonense]